MTAWIRALPPRAILAIGWLGFFMYAYPGLMTRESIDLLRQARAGVITDDHPSLLQAIVAVVDRLVAGPIGIVILQSILLLAGAYLLLRRAMRDSVAAVVAVGFLLFPPVLAVMVVMWKESMMAGALVLAAALIVSPSRRTRLAGLALVLVGAAVRPGALAATFAIVVVLFEWLEPRGSRARQALQRYGLALAVWLAVTAAAFGVDALLADHHTPHAAVFAVPTVVTHGDQDDTALWDLGISTTTSPLQERIDAILTWLADTPVFDPRLYFGLALALLALLAFSRANRVVAALLLGGLAMQLSQPASFRGAHWMICATILAGILLFAERLRGYSRRP